MLLRDLSIGSEFSHAHGLLRIFSLMGLFKSKTKGDYFCYKKDFNKRNTFMNQVEMISLNGFVPTIHFYSKFFELWDFTNVAKRLSKKETNNVYKGYEALRLFKYLLLQFMEDLSDRRIYKRIWQPNN